MVLIVIISSCESTDISNNQCICTICTKLTQYNTLHGWLTTANNFFQELQKSHFATQITIYIASFPSTYIGMK